MIVNTNVKNAIDNKSPEDSLSFVTTSIPRNKLDWLILLEKPEEH